MARPIIKIEWSTVDWLLEGITLFIFLGIVVFTILQYQDLPNRIPTHFGANGSANSFGSKSTLWILFGVNFGMYVLLSAVSKIPHHFNYLVTITENNAHRQYTIALRMMRTLKLMVVLSFGYILVRTVVVANDESTSLGIWFLPMFLTTFFVPFLFYIVISKNK
jgi:uncharacterized membrane protein